MVFIFDENLPEKLCEGLHVLESGNRKSRNHINVIFAAKLMGESGATDEQIIPEVGRIGGVIITQDRDFINKLHYYELYRQYNVGVIVFEMAVKETYWEKVKAFVKHWEHLKDAVLEAELPFVHKFTKNGKIEPLKKFKASLDNKS